MHASARDVAVLPPNRVRIREVAWRSRLSAAFVLAACGLFAALALGLRGGGGSGIDLAISRAVQSLDHAVVDLGMFLISQPGYPPWDRILPPAIILGFLVAGFRREALFLAIAPGASLLSAAVKVLVERPRPPVDVVRVSHVLTDYGFPSGHVVHYVSFYGFVLFLAFVLFRSSPARAAVLWGLGLLIGVVGVSRIYLGLHWASDVVGGYALGAAYLVVLIELYRLLLPRPRPARPAPSPAGTRELRVH
jgi:undecaprenyl-diphosphatase